MATTKKKKVNSLSTIKFRFGKHIGKTLAWVVKNDLEYSYWIIRNTLHKKIYKPRYIDRIDEFILGKYFCEAVGIKNYIDHLDKIAIDFDNAAMRREKRKTLQEAVWRNSHFDGSGKRLEYNSLIYLFDRLEMEDNNEWRANITHCLFEDAEKGGFVAIHKTKTMGFARFIEGGIYYIRVGASDCSPVLIKRIDGGDGNEVERRGSIVMVNGKRV